MNDPMFHRRNRLILRAALGAALAVATACSRRKETPAPVGAPPQPMPAGMADVDPHETVAGGGACAAEAPVPAGADLEKVAQNAVAFSDLVDSLRKYAGKETALNADTLVLESFVRGKSNRDLMKFARTARDKSPFAAMQVLDYLWRQDLDVESRIEIAGLLGDLAVQCGYEKDFAMARECVDWLVATCADPVNAAAMSVRERDNLICTLARLTVNLDGQTYAAEKKKIADAIRASAQSDLELAYADEFDAFALMREGKAENVPAARAYFESMRARGVYGTFFALKMRVDYWLAFDDAAFAAEIRKMADLHRKVRELNEVERQRRASMTPTELVAEMRREAEKARRRPQAQKNP